MIVIRLYKQTIYKNCCRGFLSVNVFLPKQSDKLINSTICLLQTIFCIFLLLLNFLLDLAKYVNVPALKNNLTFESSLVQCALAIFFYRNLKFFKSSIDRLLVSVFIVVLYKITSNFAIKWQFVDNKIIHLFRRILTMINRF